MNESFAELILGASYSLDVINQGINPYIPLEDVVHLADQRLIRRWIVGRDTHSNTNEEVNRRLLSDLKESGWDTRICEKPATMNLVLVDDRSAFIELIRYTGSGLEARPAMLVTDANLIVELRRSFDSLWTYTQAVYEEPSSSGHRTISSASSLPRKPNGIALLQS